MRCWDSADWLSPITPSSSPTAFSPSASWHRIFSRWAFAIDLRRIAAWRALFSSLSRSAATRAGRVVASVAAFTAFPSRFRIDRADAAREPVRAHLRFVARTDLRTLDQRGFGRGPVLRLEEHHPAGAVGVLVGQRRPVDERFVHRHELAAGHRLRRPDPLARLDRPPALSRLDVTTDPLRREGD